MNKITSVISWILSLWIAKVFLGSIPFKFSGHPMTTHIFTTIGDWMGGFLGDAFGGTFGAIGPYVIGSFELLASILLLLPAILWLLGKLSAGTRVNRSRWHLAGGALATALMAGASFFHLVTPLGVNVVFEGQSDGGSLFYAAISVVISGIILVLLNHKAA